MALGKTRNALGLQAQSASLQTSYGATVILSGLPFPISSAVSARAITMYTRAVFAGDKIGLLLGVHGAGCGCTTYLAADRRTVGIFPTLARKKWKSLFGPN